MTDIYFCPHRSSSSSTKFYIITFFQLLHVFLCSKTSSKKVLGQWDTFICFDMQVQVIGSSVLDLQDKQWHIGVADIDLRRTLNQGLELWQYAWCHDCAWMAWIWNVAEESCSQRLDTGLLQLIERQLQFCPNSDVMKEIEISITVHIYGTWLLCTTTVYLCPLLHVSHLFAWCTVCLNT